MGTNYYGQIRATPELKSEIIDLINNNMLLEVKRRIPDHIHIGKSSFGWEFIFNHNSWEYFDKNIESLKSFLKSVEIEDEYGRPVTFDEFWKMVESKKGQSVSSHDISFFGLRFSTSTDFC